MTTPVQQENSYLIKLWNQLTESLSIPDYRYLWFNSILGSARLIAIFVVRGWLVLTLTDSAFWVGAAPAMRGITQILLGSFIGVLLDRVNRKWALLIAEVGSSLTAVVIGFLILSGQIELWHVLVVSVVEGVFISVRWPAINTMILQAVGTKRVLNASAAQMLGFNMGNVAASAVTGWLIVQFGMEYGYFFAAGMGLLAAAAVFFVSGDFSPKPSLGESVMQSLTAGLSYIRGQSILAWLIVLGFLMSLLGWSNLTMMPVMARDILGVGADGLGYLTAAGAIGSLISTIFIASLGDFENKGMLIKTAGVCTTLGIFMFAFSPIYALSLVLVAFMQGALMAFEVSLTAMVLLLTAEEMQGRVQGIYTQVFGFTWVGGVVLGSIATFTGAPVAIAVGGLGIMLAIALLWGRLGQISGQ
ncbi:MAG: MFS transporter [Chloroflexota bacterium]